MPNSSTVTKDRFAYLFLFFFLIKRREKNLTAIGFRDKVGRGVGVKSIDNSDFSKTAPCETAFLHTHIYVYDDNIIHLKKYRFYPVYFYENKNTEFSDN